MATIARRPIEIVERRRFCDIDDSRHLSVTRCRPAARRILIHNFYVPAGGDEPDPDINPKFRHKLDFVAEMSAVRADIERRDRLASWSAISTSRRSSTMSGRTSSCSTWSAIRRSRRTSFEAMRHGRRLGRPDAAQSCRPTRSSTPGGATARATGRFQPRPPARPCLVVGQSVRAAGRHRGPARSARLGPAVRPCAGDCPVRPGLGSSQLVGFGPEAGRQLARSG